MFITAAMSSGHGVDLFDTVNAAPMQLASPATVAHGEQRSPQAGKRVDATDDEGVVLTAQGVLSQFQSYVGREDIVGTRARLDRQHQSARSGSVGRDPGTRLRSRAGQDS